MAVASVPLMHFAAAAGVAVAAAGIFFVVFVVGHVLLQISIGKGHGCVGCLEYLGRGERR